MIVFLDEVTLRCFVSVERWDLRTAISQGLLICDKPSLLFQPRRKKNQKGLVICFFHDEKLLVKESQILGALHYKGSNVSVKFAHWFSFFHCLGCCRSFSITLARKQENILQIHAHTSSSFTNIVLHSWVGGAIVYLGTRRTIFAQK